MHRKMTRALPLFSVLGGCVVFALRVLQDFVGFSPETGLPIPRSPMPWIIVLALMALLLISGLLVQSLPFPHPDPRPPEEIFAIQTGIFPLALGVVLLTLAGLDHLHTAIAAWFSLLPRPPVSVLAGLPRLGEALDRLDLHHAIGLFSSLLLTVSAPCMLPAIFAIARGRHSPPRKSVSPLLLLPMPTSMTIHLVHLYRDYSTHHSPERYAWEILATCAVTLAFFRLCAFAFQDGSARRFAFAASCSVILCGLPLADDPDFPQVTFFLGCSMILLGFLCAVQPLPRRRKRPEPVIPAGLDWI